VWVVCLVESMVEVKVGQMECSLVGLWAATWVDLKAENLAL
jgi:hypothetical protein